MENKGLRYFFLKNCKNGIKRVYMSPNDIVSRDMVYVNNHTGVSLTQYMFIDVC